MKRITISPDCEAENCSDLCGSIPTAALLSDCMRRLNCERCIIFKALKRLKEYEDTGLTPKQIRNLTIHTTMPKEWIHKNGSDN